MKFLVLGKLKEVYADWEGESTLCSSYAEARKLKSGMLKSGYFEYVFMFRLAEWE